MDGGRVAFDRDILYNVMAPENPSLRMRVQMRFVASDGDYLRLVASPQFLSKPRGGGVSEGVKTLKESGHA
jgi:hypothetical protein